MSDSFIPAGTSGKDLQTYLNTVSGRAVHSEAVTPTDDSGVPFDDANPFTVKSGPRTAISGLSFVETIGSGSFHQTSWVQIDDRMWMDFDAELEAAESATALIEFTDTADPNVTPPGANDIVRGLTTTLAGSTLSGLSTDVLSFGLPAQMLWTRLKVTDLTGGQTIKVRCYGTTVPPPGALIPLNAGVTADFRAPLVQAVNRAHDPAGTFQSVKFSGIVASQSSTTTITAAGSFTGSAWVSTTGYVGVGMFLKSDANSATDGVILQLSYDDGVTVHYENPRTYDAAPDGVIFKWSIATPGAHFRIKVTAGGSNMTSLVLKTYLIAQPSEDVSVRIGDDVTPDMVADVVKAQSVGLKDDGITGANQTFSDAGHPRISIKQHEVATPIRPLVSGGRCTKTTVTTGAAQKIVATPLANRAGIRAYFDPDNTDDIYIGYSSGITPGSTDSFRVQKGLIFEWDHSAATDIYVCSNTTSQVIWVEEVADSGVAS